MISAIVDERLEVGASAKLERGTLRLRRVKPGEHPVFIVNKVLDPGEEVWVVPLDARLSFNGVPVAGAATVGGTSATPS